MDIGKIGFGVYKLVDEEKLLNALDVAVKTGYKLIDTATYYKNQDVIGKFLKNCPKRNDIYITTKIWPDDMKRDDLFRSFEKSYKELDGKIDIVLLHWPHPKYFVEGYKALEELYNQKVIKKIGVSNFEIHHLEKIKKECSIKPFLNQIELHPKLYQKDILEYNNKEEILTQSWSPIGKARYFDDERLVEISNRNNITVAQTILAWHLSKGIMPLPKSETPHRIIENFNSLNVSLSKEDLLKIDKMDENFRLGYIPDEFPFYK